MIDYSKLSNEDLINLNNNDYSKISDEGLKIIYADNTLSDEENNLQGQGTEAQPFQVGVEKFDWANVPEQIKKDPGQALRDMVEESQKRKDPILDPLKGSVQGLSKLGIGLGNKVLRPLFGKKVLNDKELVENLGWVADKPRGIGGNIMAFVGEMAPYFALPGANLFKGAGLGARVGNSALTNAYQGGLIGGIESLRNEGNLSGVGTGAAFGGTLGTAFPLVGASVSKLLPRVGTSIAGISPETIKQAIKPNSQALDLKPDTAQALLYDTTQNVRNAYNNLLSKRGQAVNEAIKNLRGNQYRLPVQDLQNDITQTFDQYGGELINPARNMTGNLERDLNKLVQGGTSDPKPILGLDKEITTNFIDNPYFSKEKQNEAYDIIGRALGKNKNWVKSRLNDPQYKGVKTQSEKLDMLLNETENLAEKEATTGDLGSQIYNNYHYNGDSGSPEAAEELINNAYNDIINNNFMVNNIDPLTRNINETEHSYRELLNKVISNASDSRSYDTAIAEIEQITKNLPNGLQEEYFNRLAKDLTTIYDKTQTISPIDLEKAKQQIGKMINWSDETARNYHNPILEQIYGKYNSRLSNLSPELATANENYANLRNFKNNEGLRRVLRAGDNIDSASSVLKNYNSTVTKGNAGRNIQDLEKILVDNGEQPFLSTIDDINAAMDLNRSIVNGRNFGGVTDIAKSLLVEPALRGARAFNRTGIPQRLNVLRENVPLSTVQILYGLTRPFNE